MGMNVFSTHSALCYVSLVGIFNTIWLLPVYITAEESDETADDTDRVVRTTIAHVPPGSARLYATVFAAYIIFGYTMYLILEEIEWYIEMRHKFLRKPMARHFAVFVRNIPHDYRNNRSLEAFFKSCFSDEDVLEARLALNAPNLAKAVAQRDATLTNLEHSLALHQRDGVRPRHNDMLVVLGETVDSIDYYTSQLEEQNKDIAQRITVLEAIVEGEADNEIEIPVQPTTVPQSISPPSVDPDIGIVLPMPSGLATNESFSKETESYPIDLNVSAVTTGSGDDMDADNQNSLFGITRGLKRSVDKATSAAGKAATAAGGVAGKAAAAAGGVANRAITMVMGGEDGEVFPAGFVVFTKLSTANAALQMIHHEVPFEMECLEAPDPEDGE